MKITNGYPWPPKELNPNSSAKLRKKIRAKMRYRDDCFFLTANTHKSIQDAQRVKMTITHYPPDSRIRDLKNCDAALKALIDGMCARLKIDDKIIKECSSKFGDVIKWGRVEITLEWGADEQNTNRFNFI